MIAVCLFVMGSAQVMADDDDEVKIFIPIGSGEILTGDDMRGIIMVPFTAYYQGDTIYISTTAEFSVITIAVENKTTGQMWCTTTDISDGMGEICIFGGGNGNYSLEIITENNECFTGDFTL